MCKLTNIIQTEHIRAKEIKNIYVPVKLPEEVYLEHCLGSQLNDCEDKKHQI